METKSILIIKTPQDVELACTRGEEFILKNNLHRSSLLLIISLGLIGSGLLLCRKRFVFNFVRERKPLRLTNPSGIESW